MALTVKIGVAGSEVDLTSKLVHNSLRVEQRADSFVSTCSLQLIDKDAHLGATLTVREKHSILVEDGAVKYFAGVVANVDIETMPADGSEALVYHIECQDYNILVEEVTIDQLQEYAAAQDDAIIDDLFDTYLPEINSHGPGGAPAGYVQHLHVFAEISFVDITLREALDRIATEVESVALEGYWYIDFDKYLHYFNVEDNAPSWFLSDDPGELPDATNLVDNPSLEVNVTDFWNGQAIETLERSATEAKYGDYSARIYESACGANEYFYSDFITVSPNTYYTLTAWIKKTICTGTGSISILWYTAGGAYISTTSIFLDSGTHDWKRYTVSGESPATAGKVRLWTLCTPGVTATTEFEAYVDGIQFEESSAATDYLDGSLGAGYAWDGDAHNSDSTRTSIASYSYLAAIRRSRMGASIINRILVIGAEMALFVQDKDSYDYYGKWFEAPVRDNTLLSVAEIQVFGHSHLARWAYHDETNDITTLQS